MQAFFRGHGTRLCDALGIEELMSLRGLDDGIVVRHAPVRAAGRRTDEDVWELEMVLKPMVVLPKGDGYGM